MFHEGRSLRGNNLVVKPKIECEVLILTETFDEQVIRVRKLFFDCMVGIEEGKDGSEEHKKQVSRFNIELDAFLDKYTDQSVGTFAAYVAELGIPHPRALTDIVRLRGMYQD